MEQKNLNFSQNKTLNDYANDIMEIELKRPPPFDYQDEKTAEAFTNFLTNLCDVYSKNGRERLVYNVNIFHDRLTKEQWGKFYYKMCLSGSNKFDNFNLDVIEKYESCFESKSWEKYILHHHNLVLDEEKNTSYSYTPKTVYYRNEENFKSLTLEEQGRADKIMKQRFLNVSINDFSNKSLKNQLKIISFLIKKDTHNTMIEYLKPEEVLGLIDVVAPKVSFEKFKAASESFNNNCNSDYYENQALKELIGALYDEIFSTDILSLEQKKHILYDTLKIDKNHFYNNYAKVSSILRDGNLDENKEMLSSITFPLNMPHYHILNEKEMILGITSTSRLQVGRGIRIATWFLDVCEKDFLKGKYLFEKFLPFIKDEMLLDKKTNAQENINFLLAYANKKGKNSIIIKNKILVVQNAISQLEKEQLSQSLQLDLFDNNATPKKFKL